MAAHVVLLVWALRSTVGLGFNTSSDGSSLAPFCERGDHKCAWNQVPAANTQECAHLLCKQAGYVTGTFKKPIYCYSETWYTTKCQEAESCLEDSGGIGLGGHQIDSSETLSYVQTTKQVGVSATCCGSASAALVNSSKECRVAGSNHQGAWEVTVSSAEECATHVLAPPTPSWVPRDNLDTSGCGRQFMYSSATGRCRCCSEGGCLGGNTNQEWDLFDAVPASAEVVVKCADCDVGSVAILPSLSISHGKLSHNTTVLHPCPSEYVGEVGLTCRYGVVTASSTRCYAPCPASERNAGYTVQVSAMKHKQTLSIPCASGYVGSGLTFACNDGVQSMNGWCFRTCPAQEQIVTSARIAVSNLSHGEEVDLRCPNGYVGNATFQCQDGVVSILGGSCNASCAAAREVDNVVVSVGAMMHGQEEIVSCPEGMKGSAKIKCEFGNLSALLSECFTDAPTAFPTNDPTASPTISPAPIVEIIHTRTASRVLRGATMIHVADAARLKPGMKLTIAHRTISEAHTIAKVSESTNSQGLDPGGYVTLNSPLAFEYPQWAYISATASTTMPTAVPVPPPSPSPPTVETETSDESSMGLSMGLIIGSVAGALTCAFCVYFVQRALKLHGSQRITGASVVQAEAVPDLGPVVEAQVVSVAQEQAASVQCQVVHATVVYAEDAPGSNKELNVNDKV
eukprot:TRINITY_DN10411_c0_g1_i1.p1 TRINITY_DN10411_c0_g1~~TRINITY_DN10411_c0_g1_i1.p1  ORF type:complete len:701 (+),score=50.50 TRINITY_DN10411_c0_g1_i1:52-2103(+)